jgi:hypothetical protein
MREISTRAAERNEVQNALPFDFILISFTGSAIIAMHGETEGVSQ